MNEQSVPAFVCLHLQEGAPIWLIERYHAEGPLPDHISAVCEECAARDSDLTEDELIVIHADHLTEDVLAMLQVRR